MKATFESQTYYKTPSNHGLRKVDVSKQVTKKMQNSIHKYGATIYYDGCDNVA